MYYAISFPFDNIDDNCEKCRQLIKFQSVLQVTLSKNHPNYSKNILDQISKAIN